MDGMLDIRSAKELARIPRDYDDVMQDVETERVYKMLYEYYARDESEVQPDVYGIEKDGEKKLTKTTLGRPKNSDMPELKMRSTGMHHSHYSKEILRDIGINLDESWNGNAIGIRHSDDSLDVVETDYYTTVAYSRLLFLESANALDSSDSVSEAFNMMSLRDEHMKSTQNFKRPSWISREGTLGGVVIANTGHSWEIVLGKRSEDPRVNPSLISVAPNGSIDYKSVREGDMNRSLASNFHEELFKGKYQPNFFADYVDSYQTLSGWNVRDGSFVIGNLLVVRDSEGYEKLVDRQTHNFEFNSLITIDVQDAEKIVETANMSFMSPSTIPYVYKGLVAFEKLDNTPELDYEILQNS